MGEQVTIDPAGTAVELERGDGSCVIKEQAYPTPEHEASRVAGRAIEGELLLDTPRPTSNRMISYTLLCQDRSGAGGPTLKSVITDLQQKVGKINESRGVLRRILDAGNGGDTIYFDALAAFVDPPADWRFLHVRNIEVPLEIETKPYGYGAELQVGTNFDETNLPALIFALGAGQIKGDVPGLGRLVITDLAGADQWTVIWALRAANYSASANAALFYEAEGRTPQGGAAIANSPGTAANTSGGATNSVIYSVNALPPNYQSLLSTQAAAGGAHLTHVGRHRVYARLWRPTSNTGQVSVCLQSGVGDLRSYAIGDEVIYPNDDREGVWTIADLGIVNIPAGAQRWEGRLLAKATGAADLLYVDCLFIVPVDEGFATIKTTPQIDQPTVYAARDEFDQAAGNLGGGKTTNGITGATNATPIQITSTAHGLANGDTVWIEGVVGNTAANGFWTIANVAVNTFTLNGSVGNGAYTSGGTISKKGKARPVSGNWYIGGSSDATDLALDTTSHVISRSTNSDTNGAIVLAPETLLTATMSQVDFWVSAFTPNTTNVNAYLLQRYRDLNNYVALVLRTLPASGPQIDIRSIVAGTQRGTSTLTIPLTAGSWWTLRLYTDNGGRAMAWVYPRDTLPPTSPTLGPWMDDRLVTGAALPSGRGGIRDAQFGAATAVTRSYNNYALWAPAVDAALYANQTLEVRHNQASRLDAAGVTPSPPAGYEGDYLLVPPSLKEARNLQMFVKASRGNFDTLPDPTLDDIRANFFYTPRYWNLPE